MPKRNSIVKRSEVRLEDAVGGREAFTEILAGIQRDSKQEILLRLLCDPVRIKDSLSKLCRDAGVVPTEILSIFRDSAMATGLAAAQAKLAGRLDSVVTDVTEKAVNHWETCGCVSSAGEIDEQCDMCGGIGRTWHRGDLKRQQLVFEAVGLTQKGGGVKVNVQQGISVSGGGSLLDSFVKATDKASFDVIEAEVVDPNV